MSVILINILKYMSQSSVYSIKKIAVNFNIEEAVVEGMISKLQDMDYIKMVQLGCKDGDGGCGKSCSCCSSSLPLKHIWQLTEKGKKAVVV